MSGGDHIHSGTVVGKLEGERDITLGFVDLLRDDFVEKDRSRGIYFTQDWVSLPGVLPVASGGIHVWHMPALTEIFGDDSGRDLAREGNEIICEASKWSPKLTICELLCTTANFWSRLQPHLIEFLHQSPIGMLHKRSYRKCTNTFENTIDAFCHFGYQDRPTTPTIVVIMC
ncbi:unnamed protein product [Linum tenue]|uniref:Ribulose bisphosphate carboxylase large subunit C-terminal domain-containing protein n=1 Tax=Linum tenue TaxID=586396 RepID=A0AAV0PZN0_9ROSI|nr:unnamed protein product [Linum tenue]